MNHELIPGSLPRDAITQLAEAKEALEHQGWADRLTDLVGTPITATLDMLPSAVAEAIHHAIDKALNTALTVALQTLGDDEGNSQPRLFTHKLLASLSGAAGGAFGLTTAAIELPVSTVLILRSVADIARSQGENLADIEARLACLEVFAIDGGRKNESSDSTEVGYFAVRAAMSKQVADASKHILQHGIRDSTAPPMVRLIAMISKRFGVVVNEKVAAQAIPIVGAVGGALINAYFIDHYQNLARAHFTIRRLERQYGEGLIQSEYASYGLSTRRSVFKKIFYNSMHAGLKDD